MMDPRSGHKRMKFFVRSLSSFRTEGLEVLSQTLRRINAGEKQTIPVFARLPRRKPQDR